MEVAVYNIKGEDTGRKITLNDDVFARDLSVGNADHTLYLDVKQFLGNQRQGTHKSKERSEVSGSTRKLHKQKGGGGSRIGDINSPVLVGGGRVFGPRPRDYRFKLNKKVKSLARKSALTYKVQDNQLIVIEDLNFEAPKTKDFINIAKNLKVDGKKVLLVLPSDNKNVTLSARNVPDAKTMVASNLNTYAIMNSNAVIITESSLDCVNKL